MRVIDRGIVYTGQVPLETDFLLPQRAAMVGLGKLAEAVFGPQTALDGLEVTPTAPASMAVRVNPGQIYQQAALDALAYGTMPADTAHQIIKQGLMMDPVTVPITAPGTPGFSQYFLVQAAFQEQEGGAVVLPYYNSANPSQAYAGPGNSGEAQYTQRNGRIIVQTKAGAPAATGTQPVPQPDPGWTPLAWIGVANGQTTIQAQHIAASAQPRRAKLKLPDIAGSIGYRAIQVTASRNLTVDDMGLVVVNLSAFSGPITLNLPPANALGNGTPLRCTIVGRFLSGVQNLNNMPYAMIQAPSGNQLDSNESSQGIYCGPNDTIQLMSDGSNGWYWVNQKHAAHSILSVGAHAAIPHNVFTAISFTGANQQYPHWVGSSPTAWTSPIWQRVQVTASVCFAGNPTGQRHARIALNGNVWGGGWPMQTTPAPGTTNSQLSLAGAPIGIRPGEWLQLLVHQDSGAPLNLIPGETWMAVEVLG